MQSRNNDPSLRRESQSESNGAETRQMVIARKFLRPE